MIGAERIDIEHALQQAINGPAVELICLDGVVLCLPGGQIARLLERFDDMEKKWNDHSAYIPAGAIPSNAPIVVRPQAMFDFIAGVNGKGDKDTPMDERERASMLRVIRALDVMASLPKRGAATPIETQLQQLGFNKPKEAVIRKLIEDARALEPDDKPQ